MSQSDFVQRGMLLVERGQYQEAVKTCRLGLLGRPGAIDGRIVLGRALLALGRYDEVLTEMRVAIDAMPSFALAHMLRGEALLGKGDVVTARASLRLAAVLAPGDPEIASKVRDAEDVPVPRHPPPPGADATETKHYLRSAEGSSPGVDEDTTTDDSPTSMHEAGANASRDGYGEQPHERRRDALLDDRREPSSMAFPDEAPTFVRDALPIGRRLDLRDGWEVDEGSTSVHLAEDFETELRAPLRASGTPVYGEAHARAGVFPMPDDSAERRGPAEETLLTLPLSPQLNPVHSTANGRTSIVAKKKNTEPLSDDALVEVPSAGFAGAASGGSGGPPGRPTKPPMRVPNIPSRPPPRASQPPPPLPPRASQPPPSRASRPSAPPPIPGSMPPPPPSQPLPVPSAQSMQRTMMAPPPSQHLPPPPPSQQLPPPPPPSQPPGPLGAQRAGAFQAYQTAMAAQPPSRPSAQQVAVPTAAPMAQTMAPQMAPQFAQQMAVPMAPPMAATMAPQMVPQVAQHAAQQMPPPQMTMLADSVPVPARAKAASQGQGKSKGKSRRKRRTGLATALWVLVGAAVIGGGVFAGFQIRDLRLRRQIDAAEKRAIESSSSDTWLGWRTARDGLASIAAARRTADSRAALARAQAVLAYELGDGAAEASATLRPLGADSRTAVARAYMAMIAGDAAAASREVGLISGESASVSEYLRGRAALLSGDAKAAIAALEKSRRADARPFTTVALAEAYAAVERWDDAQKILEAGLAKSPEHPALIVAKASIADRLGKHTPETSAADIARLEKVAAEGGKPLASQARGVSRWQAAQALLVEAGLQLRRGEREAAIASIGRALDLGVDEQRLAEASVQALLAADLADVAVAGAKRGLSSWPQSMVLRTVLAQGAFAEGHISEVIEALPDALIGKDPLALAVRARAKISVGDLEGARKDLDVVAAAASPELTVARSLLKLASGETIPAAPASSRPDLSLVQAMAARLRGEPAKAVAILEPLARGPMGAERYTIRLELARSYRDVANYASARAAYADLASLNSPTVRLEGAQLLLEDRDPKGAREHIEALLRDLGDKASGMVLVEAMRIRTLTGGATAAEQLADRAFKAGAPPWMLNREAARIARRRDDFSAAVTALSKALDGSKSDIDTLLLACDLVDGAPDAFVAKVTKAVEERLVGLPDQLVAQGKLAIARKERDKAAELFSKAAQRFMEKPAAARRVAQASFGAGALAVGRGDWVTAKLKLEAALELDPSLVDAYLYQAEALASSNALKQAIARLKLASEYSPESATVWQLLANRANEAGDRKTAAEAAKRADDLLSKKKPS